MAQPLSRAVGRFVFAAGSDVALNFMPLKEFHLDLALDASAIVALRAAREGGNRALADRVSIGTWTDRLAVAGIAAAVRAVAPAGPLAAAVVGPGTTLLPEVLAAEPELRLSSCLVICPEAQRRRMELLYAGLPGVAWAPMAALASAHDVVVLDQSHAMRHGVGLALDWAGLAARLEAPVVLAQRVSLAGPRAALTANGHAVGLPDLAALAATLRASPKRFGMAVRRGFDDAFFLPEPDDTAEPPARRRATTALVIAAAGAAGAPPPAGFEPV